MIPALGSGLGYRRELKAAILEARERIDFVEIVADQFMDSPAQLTELESLRDVFPVIPHGVGLSIGTIAPLPAEYLRAVKSICDATRTPYFSEHLAVTRVPGIDIGHLSPIWFSERALNATVDNVCRVQDYLGRPLVLETITYPLAIPGADLSQGEFFSRLVDLSGCGVLLDVTNVYVNSVNHHFDPVSFLKDMPLDRVVQIHLAGGFWSEGVLVDGHCEPVDDGSWGLLEKLADMIAVRASIIEQDDKFPDDPTALIAQVDKARRIIANGKAALEPAMMKSA